MPCCLDETVSGTRWVVRSFVQIIHDIVTAGTRQRGDINNKFLLWEMLMGFLARTTSFALKKRRKCCKSTNNLSCLQRMSNEQRTPQQRQHRVPPNPLLLLDLPRHTTKCPPTHVNHTPIWHHQETGSFSTQPRKLGRLFCASHLPATKSHTNDRTVGRLDGPA